MRHRRRARDAAWDLSRAVVRVFAPLLRDEELADAHRVVWDLLVPGLERLLDAYDLELRLLRPLGGDPEGEGR